MRLEEHVEECVREQRRAERHAIQVHHRPLDYYSLERAIEESEESRTTGNRRLRRLKNAILRGHYRRLAISLERASRARSMATWREWDAPGRMEKIVESALWRSGKASLVTARREFVQDTAQDVRTRVTEKVAQYDPRKAEIGAWLRVIATNIVKANLRREAGQTMSLTKTGEVPEPSGRGPAFITPEQMIELERVKTDREAKLLLMRNLMETARDSSLTDAEKKREQRARRRLREEK